MSWAQRVEEASTVEAKLRVLGEALDWIATTPPAVPKAKRAPSAERRHLESIDVRRVYEAWVRETDRRATAKLTPERRQKIQARLREGYSVDDMIAAIKGCAGSDFHMARGEYQGGKKYDDLTLILRTGSKMEWFRDMQVNGPDPDAFLAA